ncbi:MAG: tetratricopeptide repeat protein [Alphaproteobacteria bacterium]|nr:tetratricopeptide repeat protein [Alphaproteobacteria bacterium]
MPHRQAIHLTQNDTPKSFAGDFLASKHAFKEKLLTLSAAHMLESYRYAPELDGLLMEAFQLKWLSGQLDDANQLGTTLIEKNSDNLAPRLLVAIMNVKNQHYQDALGYIEPMLKTNEKITNIHQLAAYLTAVWAHVGLHEDEKAKTILKQLASSGVFTLPADYYIGLIDDVEGHLPEAVQHYQSLLQADIVSYRITRIAANAFERHANKDLAIQMYQLFAKKGASENFSVEREIQRLQKGSLKAPSPVLTTPSQGLSSSLLEIVSALYSKGMLHESMAYSYLAKTLDPTHDEPKLMIGLIHQDQDLCQEALEQFRDIPEASGYYYPSAINQARCLIKLNQDFDATKLLLSLTVKYPQFSTPHLVLGDFYFEKKDYNKAIENYQSALKTMGSDTPIEQSWPVSYALAFSYQKSNEWDKAFTILTDLKKQLPDEPEILNFLGYSQVLRNQNLDEALAMISKALQAKPNDAHIIDSMGWALYTLKRYDDALPYLERAIEITPDDPVLLDHLASIYDALGRKHEALYKWRQALELKPEKEDEDTIKKHLNQPDIKALEDHS